MPEPPNHVIRFEKLAAEFMSDIRKGQPKVAQQIQNKVDELKVNKFPNDSIKLKGVENTYRVNVGEYRIVYEVISGRVIVWVVRIEHRKDVYR
jgi:mRNA interferase RelE/StbE